MGGNFTFRRIVQDAFDPVALSDEVDESRVSSVKHGLAAICFLWCRHCRLVPVNLRDVIDGKEHHRDRVSPTVIAKALGIGLASVYRVLEAGR
jgi:hypothetical protein